MARAKPRSYVRWSTHYRRSQAKCAGAMPVRLEFTPNMFTRACPRAGPCWNIWNSAPCEVPKPSTFSTWPAPSYFGARRVAPVVAARQRRFHERRFLIDGVQIGIVVASVIHYSSVAHFHNRGGDAL